MTAPTHPPIAYQDRHTVLGDLRESFTEVAAHRELLYRLTMRDIKIRSQQTGQRVFEPRSWVYGVRLSAPGASEFVADPQPSLLQGLHQVESRHNDADLGQCIGDGPQLQFLVEQGSPQIGQVQLNPSLSLGQGGG